jgi:hypothetical protein
MNTVSQTLAACPMSFRLTYAYDLDSTKGAADQTFMETKYEETNCVDHTVDMWAAL